MLYFFLFFFFTTFIRLGQKFLLLLSFSLRIFCIFCSVFFFSVLGFVLRTTSDRKRDRFFVHLFLQFLFSETFLRRTPRHGFLMPHANNTSHRSGPGDRGMVDLHQTLRREVLSLAGLINGSRSSAPSCRPRQRRPAPPSSPAACNPCSPLFGSTLPEVR